MQDILNGPKQFLSPRCCGRDWMIERTADLETLWDSIGEDEFGDDERLPYWAELWPSSFVLAEWLESNKEQVDGRRCVDMGCGLGLTALVGSWLGARVAAFDYELEPLVFAARNARHNDVANPLWLQMDWRDPGIAGDSADFVWGGDIVYEKRFIEPVGAFVDHVLRPQGKAWIAEPNRSIGPHFIEWMNGHGFSCRRAVTRVIPHALHVVTVHILEIKREA